MHFSSYAADQKNIETYWTNQIHMDASGKYIYNIAYMVSTIENTKTNLQHSQ